MKPDELVELAERIAHAGTPRDPLELVAWCWRTWADAMFGFGHAMADVAHNARKGVIPWAS